MSPIRIIAILAAMAGAYLAAWQTSGSHVSGALGALAVLTLALPSPVIKPKAGVLLALLLPLGLTGCTNLAPGYRALVIVKEAGDQTGKTMAAVCKTKRLACVAEHSTDKVLLTACLAPCTDALRAWVRVAKPAIRSAQLATWAALETAYAAKKHEVGWLELLKPGACALIRVLRQWQGLAGDRFRAIIRTVGALEGMVCQ